MSTNIPNVAKKEKSLRQTVEEIITTTGAGLADGDYGDILVSGSGGIMTVEQAANVYVVEDGANLQTIIDTVGAGATLLLNKGSFYGAGGSATPSTPLTITASHYQLKIIGMGEDYSIIKSPILMESGQIHLQHVWVRPSGTTYGVKIFKAGSFLSRGSFMQVRIGASSSGAGDGPQIGLLLDGAGLLLAEQLLCAFCTSDGLRVDSTSTEPNTTLKFDMCSFVANSGYGVKLMASCSVAEFNGGNLEQNVTGEMYAENMNSLRLLGLDFETNQTFGNSLECQNCNPVEVTGCNFVRTAGSATRAVLLAGSGGFTFDQNRISGWGSVGVVRISETCINVRVGVNTIANSGGTEGWFEDYSRP